MSKRKQDAYAEAPPFQAPPTRSAEEQENRMISRAMDLAEEQLANGTASSQVITHFLKLGSSRERFEQEKLELENKLLEAKTDAIRSAERVEELYSNAIKAMQLYQGN